MIENKKGILISTVSQVIGRFATLIFSLISIKLITNYLGTSGTGEFNTITTYINFFIVIADLGLFSVTVREISKNPAEEKKIISNVLFLRIVTALIACFIAGAIVQLTKYDQSIKTGVIIALGFLFFNLLSSVYDVILQYRLKMQYSALAEFFSKIVSLVALIIIIQRSGSFLWIVLTSTISGIAIYLFKAYFSRRFISFSPKYNKEVSSWIIKAAVPLGVVFIVNNLYFKIDTLVLFVVKGAAAVGIYSVAYKVLEVTLFIGSYFASSLKPSLARNINNTDGSLASIINKSFSVMLIVAMPIAIASMIFSKEIIIFLSNKDFVSGSNALLMLSMTLPIIYLDALLGEILIAKDSRKLLISVSIFIFLFNLILNLVLIPIYSFMGAAFVTLLSEIVLFCINFYYTKKIVTYKIDFKIIGKILLVSTITLVIGLLVKKLPIHFLFSIAFTTLIYIVLINIFNIVTWANIKRLISAE